MEYNELVEKMASEILGIEKEAKEEKKKDPNRTTFWHDRVLSAYKNAIPASIGSAVGAGVGMKLAKKNPLAGYVAGSTVGGLGVHSAVAASRLKRLSEKEGQTPTKGDYAKATLGNAMFGFANTPEAIIKAKKRKAEKVAAYYEQAQLMKQAAEETYLEAQAMEDAATLAYNSLNQ
jgi:hypothetical protein